MMRSLVIGYGSIGARHGRLLSELGSDVASVTRNPDCPFRVFRSVQVALEQWRPDFVIISNQTDKHAATLGALAKEGFAGQVLVEKPLSGSAGEQVSHGSMRVHVAYNLRFHPLVLALRQQLGNIRLFNASFHVGQYLPQWRPGTDYRTCYSARRDEGGGVLRDLSHELDLANWLCGTWKHVTAIGGQFSDLDITSDDTFCLLAETARCPAVSITLNYLDRMPRRMISVNGEGVTATLDLIDGRLDINGHITRYTARRDETYTAQLQALLAGDEEVLCRLDEGMETDRLIAAAETAARSRCWISRH